MLVRDGEEWRSRAARGRLRPTIYRPYFFFPIRQPQKYRVGLQEQSETSLNLEPRFSTSNSRARVIQLYFSWFRGNYSYCSIDRNGPSSWNRSLSIINCFCRSRRISRSLADKSTGRTVSTTFRWPRRIVMGISSPTVAISINRRASSADLISCLPIARITSFSRNPPDSAGVRGNTLWTNAPFTSGIAFGPPISELCCLAHSGVQVAKLKPR